MLEECNNIQAWMYEERGDSLAEIIERGNTANDYIARTGEMLADAKRILREKMRSEIMKDLIDVINKTPYMTSKAINALVESLCSNEHYLVDKLERLNHSLVKEHEWCRTRVSLAKQEMQYDLFVNKPR